MRTSYCLVTAAGLAAAAGVVYTQYPGRSGARELPPPTHPLPPLPTRFGPADVPLPPVVSPPDAPLVIPVAVRPLPAPPAPAVPVPPVLPPIPDATPPNPGPPVASYPPERPAPAPPVLPPVAARDVRPAPVVPVPVPPPPAPPVVAPTPSPVFPPAPTLPVLDPVPFASLPQVPPPAPVLPKPAPAPVPVTPPPALLPPPRREVPPPAPAAAKDDKKYVVLKGERLVEATAVTAAGDKVLVRQGSIDRPYPKADVLFVGESRDEVHRFMASRVPEADAAGRVKMARWLMFNGLREQAWTEARQVAQAHPTHAPAADLVRSLEESLRQFPADGSAPVVAAKPPAPGGALETTGPEADLTPEGATAFAARAQPVLANQCMDCHARPDYAGPFKLVRVTGFEVGPQSTKANLRATAGQLRRDEPLNSPLLAKALSAHGGMKQPAFPSRQSGGYKVLEAWVASAVVPLPPPMGEPALPPMHTPAAPQVATAPPAPPAPTLPPVEPAPALAPVAPEAPPIPPAVDTPPALPMVPLVPPVELPPTPALPLPPPADALPAVPPVLPTPPSLPPVEAPVKVKKPAAPSDGGFGSDAPPKPAPTGPVGRDEFDPDAFNRAAPRK